MANVLKMEKQILVQQLLKLGWSYRKIERETGIRRETIAKYDGNHPNNQQQAAAVDVPSAAIVAENRPICSPNESVEPHVNHRPLSAAVARSQSQKPTRTSDAAPFDDIIRQKLTLGLSAQRIYQDLVIDHQFRSGYDSVKRYVRKIALTVPKVYARIHTLPGEEAQVDFGKGAPTLKNGRYVRPWLFKIVLSYSRHSYEHCVWHQDVASFIRCHEQAFEAFGGVPAVIRLDNLKAGVLTAHLFEPELNPVYVAFARHYQFAPLPCLPGKPEHKGKTEAGVGYTQDNALKGRRFNSLDEQNAYLRHWNKTWARTRIHGTTKQQVWSLFCHDEQAALKPLPPQRFEFFNIGTRKVHYDGHIEINQAYYSVPHQLVGEVVAVQFNTSWIKVLIGQQLVAFHRTTAPGRFQTDHQHLPANKCLTTEQFKIQLLTRCRHIGTACYRWAMQVINQRQQLGLRAIQGVLRLAQSYAPDILNQACAQALTLGSTRYHLVKALCEAHAQATDPDQTGQLPLLQHHELIRSPQYYHDYIETMQHNQITQHDGGCYGTVTISTENDPLVGDGRRLTDSTSGS